MKLQISYCEDLEVITKQEVQPPCLRNMFRSRFIGLSLVVGFVAVVEHVSHTALLYKIFTFILLS